MGHWKRGPKWSSPVPYRFGWRVRQDQNLQARINNAIKQYENKTEVRFVARSDEDEYVFFVMKGKKRKKLLKECCNADIGRGGGEGGKTRVRLTANAPTVVITHEIGHALGLFHEHQRRDRNNHVTVFWDNIRKNKKHNFKKTKKGKGRRLGSYDYGSIMHYRSTQYAKTPGLTTILAKDGSPLSGTALSATDIQTVNKIVH